MTNDIGPWSSSALGALVRAVGEAAVRVLCADPRIAALTEEIAELNAELSLLVKQRLRRGEEMVDELISQAREARRAMVEQLQRALTLDALAREKVRARAESLVALGIEPWTVIERIFDKAPSDAADLLSDD